MKKIIIVIILIFIALGGFIAFRAISLSKKDLGSQVQIPPVNNLRHARLEISGMWCSFCAVSAEYALKEKAGVVNATVGFDKNLKGVGEVIYNPNEISLEEIIKAVEPYKASLVKDEQATSIDLIDLPK